MGLKIYLGAPWDNRDQAREAATLIVAAGHTITEPWWDQTPTTDVEELKKQAFRDIEGVLGAELMIVYQLGPSEGKAVETGIAITSYVPTIVVNPSGDGGRGIGNAGNLFQVLLPIFASMDEALVVAKNLEIQRDAYLEDVKAKAAMPPTPGAEPVGMHGHGMGDGRSRG